MPKRRWFLPETPDVLGMLRDQADVTADGMHAFLRWAQTPVADGHDVREAEHRADDCKRRLAAALREAFTTPLDPEDLYELSRGLDEVINAAKDTVREAEALDMRPNDEMTRMCALLDEGVSELRTAFYALGGDEDEANAASARAVKTQRRLERVYREAMSRLAASEDLREVVGRQELYRRMTNISSDVVRVADRVGYSTVKEA